MNKNPKSRFLVERLEPRLLLSSDTSLLPIDCGVPEFEHDTSASLALRPENTGVQSLDIRMEVVFVDPAIDDYRQLIHDLKSQAETGRDFEIVVLDSGYDGISQISSYLNQRQDVAAVHIVSHGADGEVVLGNGRLNLNTLDTHAEDIGGWRHSLSQDADILFYGCDMAAGDDGRALIDTLRLLTGADVAASMDTTGNTALGGDWDLEFHSGSIETDIPFSIKFRRLWPGLLVWITTTGNASGGGQPGIDTWERSDIVRFADPNLTFDPGTTNGTFSMAAAMSVFAIGHDINGIHYVSSNIQVGTNNFQLNAGDLLFVSRNAGATDFGNLNVNEDDVVHFRPDTPGNYGSGTFTVLFRDMVSGQEIRGITLVESNTDVGGVTVNAGDFLFLRDGDTEEEQVWRYAGYTVGDAPGGGTATVLIKGQDANVNITDRLMAIDLVESDTTIGGRTLTAGTLLLTVDNSSNVGSNNELVDEYDIFALDVITASDPVLADIGDATASLFFDGSDVNFSGGSDDIDGITLTTTIPANDVPVATANTVTTTEDTAYTFAVADFTFTDTEGDPLASVTITNQTLSGGTLQLSGVDVTNGDTIPAANIPNLVYSPVADAFGTPLATFEFTVNDAGLGTVSAQMDIDVTAVNDVPVATANTVTTTEDTPRTFAVADFTFTDTEGDLLASVTITNQTLAGGTLQVSGTDVTNGDTIPAANIPNLVYTPVADAFGTPLATFEFTVNDAGLGTVSAQMDIDITAVNDVPVASANTVTTTEDTPRTFAVADFTFTDTEGDLLASVTITNQTLAGGTLQVSGVDVTNGDTIPAANIPNLVYTPAANAFGTPLATFDFTVNDSGLGENSARMNIHVTAENNVPVATANTVTTSTNSSHIFAIVDFTFTDTEGDALVSVTITNVNMGGGTLRVSGADVTNGDTILSADIPDLVYTPAPNAFGTPLATFDFTVNDSGTGTVSAQMDINVTAVNQAPVLVNTNLTISQGETVVLSAANLSASDVDNDDTALVFTVSNVTGGRFELTGNPGVAVTTFTRHQIDTGTVVFVDDNDITAPAFDVAVSDGEFSDGPKGASIHYNIPNRGPTIAGTVASQNADEHATISLFSGVTIRDADIPAQSLTVVVRFDRPENGRFSALNGFTQNPDDTYTFMGTAAAATNAIRGMVFDPADGNVTTGGFATTRFTIRVDDGMETVTDSNTTVVSKSADEPPTVMGTMTDQSVNDDAVISPFDGVVIQNNPRDQTVTVTVSPDSDGNGRFTQLNGFSEGPNGAHTFIGTASEATAAIRGLVFDPADNRLEPGSSQTTRFTIRVDDGSSSVVDMNTTVIATSVNDAPTAIELDNVIIDENAEGVLIGNLASMDPDVGDTHVYTVEDGRFEVVNGQLRLGPGQFLDFETTPTVNVTIHSTDAGGLGTDQTFELRVQNVNERPETRGDELNAMEDSALTIHPPFDLIANDGDVDGDPITLAELAQPSFGTLTDNGDGTVTYTPNSNFNGIDVFTYTITDPAGEMATGQAVIIVHPVGDTPTVTDVSTFSGIQSDPVFIYPNENDGSEVTHFRISGITNGALYLADGVTRIGDGDFITVDQGREGVRFTPSPSVAVDGGFGVEPSTDGVSVPPQSGMAKSTITLLAPVRQSSMSASEPPEPNQSPNEVIVESELGPTLNTVAEPTRNPPAETGFDADNDRGEISYGVDDGHTETSRPGETRESSSDSLETIQQEDSRTDNDTPSETVVREQKTISGNHRRTESGRTLAAPSPGIHEKTESPIPEKTSKPLSDKPDEPKLEAVKLAIPAVQSNTTGIQPLPPETYALIRKSLDAFKDEISEESRLEKTIIGAAITTSIGLTAGYVVWMLQGGSLLASLLASMPAWKITDPLAIFSGKKKDDDEKDDDDESLETIILDHSREDEDKMEKPDGVNT